MQIIKAMVRTKVDKFSGSSNGGGVAQAASQVAGAVANAAGQTPIGKAVTQAAATVTNAAGNNASQVVKQF